MKLVKSLQRLSKGIDDRMEHAGFQLFKHSALVRDGPAQVGAGSDDDDHSDDGDDSDGMEDGSGSEGEDEDEDDDEEGDDDDDDDDDHDDDEEDDSGSDGDDDDDEEGDDDEDDSESDAERSGMGHTAKWKSDLAEKAAASFLSRCVRRDVREACQIAVVAPSPSCHPVVPDFSVLAAGAVAVVVRW